jgi:Skp family chaperone for outer membrane proteins
MSQRYETLLKEIDNTKSVADPKALAAKASEAEALKVNIERKQQDGQADLDRRLKNLTDPIYEDINTALTAFAKQRNVNIILDASKLRGAMLVVNEQVDITKAFIAEYNSKNPLPAAAPATTPAAPKP